jgi:transcriptional regulator with PAS, ATPase and Fis domain
MPNHHVRPLIGWSQKMLDLHAEIDTTAPTDMTVMIEGERGTGKELVAHAIHLKSSRASGPLIKLNCASLPEQLVETELFGCERGAFTGAESREGRFEQAKGGTLLLDEIGDFNLASQAKLLRVLEEREVYRIGGKKPIPLDFRLIVSTNRNLKEMARTHAFREDLYDRLSQDTIRTPPLRERLDDIPVLCEYLIGEYVPKARRRVTGVSEQVLDLFQSYSWPGNIRELENIVRRGVFKGRSEQIRVDDLPFDFGKNNSDGPVKLGNYRRLMRENSRHYSRQLVVAALNQCGGCRPDAAKLLELERKYFYKLAKIHGVDGQAADKAPAPRRSTEDFGWLQ